MFLSQRFRYLLGTVVVLGVLCGACNGGHTDVSRRAGSKGRMSTTSTSASIATTRPDASTRVPVGTLPVGIHTEEWIDTSRPLPANGRAPGAPVRSMPATIWYPAVGPATGNAAPDAASNRAHAPFPLVVFAHGFAVTPMTYTALLTRWASAGYVVVAPAIPLLNADAPGGPSHADYGAANVADMEFAVSEAVRRASTAGDLLDGLADPRHLAIAGHSDGEVLGYLLTFGSCCRDPRVKSAVLMAGNLDNARELPAATGASVLHVMSEHDEYNSYTASIAFDRVHLASPRYMLTLLGAHHEAPYVDPSDGHFGVVATATIDFLDATLKARADGTTRLASDTAAAGQTAQLESSP